MQPRPTETLNQRNAAFDNRLRPSRFEEFVGQQKVRDRLLLAVEAARQRKESLDHVLLSGPPGLGKTTLAYILGDAMGVHVKATSGPVIDKPGDLAGLLTSLEPGDIIFIDEIHRIQRTVEEYLYSAMEDFVIDIMIDQGPNARSVRLELPRFTLVGATTRSGLISAPLRSRFGISNRLDYYGHDDLQTIVTHSAAKLEIEIDAAGGREIARRSLETLVRDGRIHPQRIEKTLEDAKREVERIMWDEGERATVEAGVPNLPVDIIKTMGRLKYRTSYGQNQLFHAVESARIAGLLASELKADVKICRAGAFLHDIGKALDRENEGTHVQLGVELLKRQSISPKIIHCVESHHHDVPQDTIEAVIVEISDAISGSRPGARRESLENYVKRVRQLEDTARQFPGVSESYAVQAGREVRIIVRPEQLDDLACIQLSRDIAKRIEESMEYPGQIKVTVVREIRAVEYAK